MKPLTMFRTRGLSGPFYSKNASLKKTLVHTPGNFISSQISVPEPIITRNIVSFSGTQYGILSTPITFSGANRVTIRYASTTTGALMPLNNLIKIEVDGTISIPAGNSITVNGVATNVAILDGSQVEVVVTGVGTEAYTHCFWDVGEFFIGNPLYQKFEDLVNTSASHDNNQTHEFKNRNNSLGYELAVEGSLGSELIANGTFDTDVNEWTSNGTLTWENGTAKIVGASVVNNTMINMLLSQPENAWYHYSFDIISSTAEHHFIYDNNTGVLVDSISSSPGTKDGAFLASASSTYFDFRGFGVGAEFIYDNISIKPFNKALIYANVTAGDWDIYTWDEDTKCWTHDTKPDICTAG